MSRVMRDELEHDIMNESALVFLLSQRSWSIESEEGKCLWSNFRERFLLTRWIRIRSNQLMNKNRPFKESTKTFFIVTEFELLMQLDCPSSILFLSVFFSRHYRFFISSSNEGLFKSIEFRKRVIVWSIFWWNNDDIWSDTNS